MNIAVIDDEYYARKALLKCIADSFAACGAENLELLEWDSGEALLALLETEEIHIVFTDIRMGDLDGIALCEQLYARHPEIQLVIISGYAEFEYAQRAIQSNVFRYLLKPVDDEEVRQVVRELLEQRQSRDQFRGREEQSAETATASVHQALAGKQYMMILLKSGQPGFSLQNKRSRFSHAVKQLPFELIELISLSPIEILLMLVIPPGRPKSEAHKTLSACVRQVVKCSELTFCLPLELGFSEVHAGSDELNAAYMEACKTIDSSAALRQVSEGEDGGLPATSYLDTITQKLIVYYLESFKIDQLEDLILTFWDTLARDGKVADENSGPFLEEALGYINAIRKMSPELRETYLPTETGAVRELQSAAECRDFFLAQMGRMKEQHSAQDNKKSLATQLVSYIDEHYSEDLNLYSIAQSQFFVHPNYLSKLLKDMTGNSFSRYLLDVRMKNAARLLERPDLSVSTIAQLVGYNSESYFVQVFHRYHGQTPGAFRKERQL